MNAPALKIVSPPVNAMIAHFETTSVQKNSARISHGDVIASFKEKIASANAELVAAKQEAKPDPDKIAELAARVATLTNERATLKSPSDYDPFPEVKRYSDSVVALRPVEVQPDIRKGETPLAAYKRRQTATDTVIRNISATAKAPRPDQHRISMAHAQIDAIADIGAPTVDGFGKISLPQRMVGPGVAGDDLAAFAVWGMRDQLKKMVESLIEPGDGASISDADREGKLAALYDELQAALRQESAIATMLEKEGANFVVRRRHVHAAILLQTECPSKTVADHLLKRKGI